MKIKKGKLALFILASTALVVSLIEDNKNKKENDKNEEFNEEKSGL